MKLLNLKQLKTRLKNVLQSKRGFTIMESVISLLILGILLTTIVTVIRFSTSLTSASIIAANEAQNRFNTLILENYDEYPSSLIATVTFTADDVDIEASFDVVVYDEDGTIAFVPIS